MHGVRAGVPRLVHLHRLPQGDAARDGGGRERKRNVLDRFAIDYSLCMYCGICIEVCPFDALYWSPEFEYAELDIHELLHEKERLAQWCATVPPPPPPDPTRRSPRRLAAAAEAGTAPSPRARPAPRLRRGGETAPA